MTVSKQLSALTNTIYRVGLRENRSFNNLKRCIDTETNSGAQRIIGSAKAADLIVKFYKHKNEIVNISN